MMKRPPTRYHPPMAPDLWEYYQMRAAFHAGTLPKAEYHAYLERYLATHAAEFGHLTNTSGHYANIGISR